MIMTCFTKSEELVKLLNFVQYSNKNRTLNKRSLSFCYPTICRIYLIIEYVSASASVFYTKPKFGQENMVNP